MQIKRKLSEIIVLAIAKLSSQAQCLLVQSKVLIAKLCPAPLVVKAVHSLSSTKQATLTWCSPRKTTAAT